MLEDLSDEKSAKLREEAFNVMLEGSAVSALSLHFSEAKRLIEALGEDFDEASAGYTSMKLLLVTAVNLASHVGEEGCIKVLQDIQEAVRLYGANPPPGETAQH